MLKIFQNWKYLVDHIKVIISSPVSSFSKKTQEAAKKIQPFLLNKNALAIMGKINMGDQKVLPREKMLYIQI